MSETTTTTTTPTTPTTTELVASATKRLFVGNLPFQAKTDDIKGLFEDFKVINVSIPKTKTAFKNGSYGFRKLGYAFVELESPEEAQRAVDSLKDKLLSERPISVRLATTSKKPRSKKAKEPKDQADGEVADKEDKPQSASTPEPAAVKEAPAAKKAPAKPKPKRKTGPISVTTIFISNLPVGTTEEEVRELTKAYGPEEVRLVEKKARKRYSVKEKKRVNHPAVTLSFVKFADEETQKKAIEELNGTTFKEIELVVKIAVDLVDEPTTAETVGASSASVEAETPASADSADVEAVPAEEEPKGEPEATATD